MANALSQIEHIVVLMLENRSFDNMLGWQFGLDPKHFNLSDQGEPIYVWGKRDPNEGYATMTIPDPDPGELFTDMNYQLFEDYFPPEGVQPPAVPSMGGFVRNYYHQTIATQDRYDPRAIMHCFDPSEVPVTSQLAAAFGVSRHWFASTPCQTWPNRFFVHTATADGYVNNVPTPAWKVIERFPYDMPTIYDQIKEHFWQFDKGWRIYFHDFPQAVLLSKLWDHLDHFHGYDRFQDDVASGNLQPYSFIEPRYFPSLDNNTLPNDQHPPHDVTLGEQLIADVYNTLRGSSYWTKTLLIVIWDEHGGCYDHVPPGPAQSPDDGRSPRSGQDGFNFNFDRYGVRIPNLLISPFIPAGSIVEPPGDVPFDHTSVIKTVRECFGLQGGPLTKRDTVAPSLAHALTLDSSNLNLGPEQIPMPVYEPPREDVAAAANAPLTGFQKALLYGADCLPSRLEAPVYPEALRAGVRPRMQPLPHQSPAEARPHVRAKLIALLGRRAGED